MFYQILSTGYLLGFIFTMKKISEFPNNRLYTGSMSKIIGKSFCVAVTWPLLLTVTKIYEYLDDDDDMSISDMNHCDLMRRLDEENKN